LGEDGEVGAGGLALLGLARGLLVVVATGASVLFQASSG
jgi:hypothetical protein